MDIRKKIAHGGGPPPGRHGKGPRSVRGLDLAHDARIVLLRRAQIARQKVQIFKPAIDNRYSNGEIVSHSEMKIPSENVSSAAELRERVDPATEVVGIDEGQFFDAELPAVATALAARGVRVIVAGLDQDYLGKPFEPMPQLLAIAEYITKTRAICMVCGNPANHTQRLVVSRDRVLLGAHGTYEARCRRCFDPTLGQRAADVARGFNIDRIFGGRGPAIDGKAFHMSSSISWAVAFALPTTPGIPAPGCVPAPTK